MKIRLIILLAFAINATTYASFNVVDNFGKNPGQLDLINYMQEGDKTKRPLVVLLHGCTQSSRDYANKSGWKFLAKKYSFNLLLPRQNKENNSKNCFNWFSSSDFSKERGEASSIRNMIKWMVENHEIDPSQIYIAGLSAGGGMANVMLANFPYLFKGGSIVAGVPFKCAYNSTTALLCMKGVQFPYPSAQQRGNAIRNINPTFKGPWPKIQIIHGKSDEVVSYSNAKNLIAQWGNVLKLNLSETDTSVNEYFERQLFGREMEVISIFGLKHGQPVDGRKNCGSEGNYYIKSNLCAALESVKFFNLDY